MEITSWAQQAAPTFVGAEPRTLAFTATNATSMRLPLQAKATAEQHIHDVLLAHANGAGSQVAGGGGWLAG